MAKLCDRLCTKTQSVVIIHNPISSDVRRNKVDPFCKGVSGLLGKNAGSQFALGVQTYCGRCHDNKRNTIIIVLIISSVMRAFFVHGDLFV